MTLGWSIFFTLTLLSHLGLEHPLSRIAKNEGLASKKNFLAANEKLYQHIFSNYNANLPPIYTGLGNGDKSSDQISEVLFTLTYAKIVEVSARKQLMTIILEYAMRWDDERLIWNPNEFNGINHIYVLRRKVWIPGILPADSLEVLEAQPEYTQHVYISNEGSLTFYNSVVTSVGCTLDATNFPFDYQNCDLKLIADTIDSHEIVLLNAVSENLIISRAGNDEWEITDIISCHKLFNSTKNNERPRFVFYMKRNATYYVMLMVLPSCMLTLLCVAALFCSSMFLEDLKKVSIGVSTMVSTSVTISTVANVLPKSKQFPNLGKYVFANLVIVSVATLLVIALPKIIRIFYLICRCRQLKRVRGRSELSFALHIVLLIVFEGCVLMICLNFVSFLRLLLSKTDPSIAERMRETQTEHDIVLNHQLKETQRSKCHS